MSTIRIALAILIISSDAHGHVTGSLCRPRPKHALNGSGRSLATTYLKIEPPPRVCVCVCAKEHLLQRRGKNMVKIDYQTMFRYQSRAGAASLKVVWPKPTPLAIYLHSLKKNGFFSNLFSFFI